MRRGRDSESAAPARADVASVPPRLLDLEAAAVYLGGISPATVRLLIADGHLPVVRFPSVRHRGETGRRLLVDTRDLDALVERCKGGAASP